MSLARKCNRCGKLYEYYPTGKKMQYNAVRRVAMSGGYSIREQDSVLDLCEDCMSSFDLWMTDGKFNETEPQFRPPKVVDSKCLEAFKHCMEVKGCIGCPFNGTKECNKKMYEGVNAIIDGYTSEIERLKKELDITRTYILYNDLQYDLLSFKEKREKE